MSRQPTLIDDHIRDVDIADRMEQAFLDYSMSVIVGRALPHVCDGLKPVQRRILYAMWEGGLRPDRPYRKCASAVGDVMKKYHPHGDAAIYDALVRMAQDFTSRLPLIDGHGNFGSVDGDGAAAMRYTEARLSEAAMAMLDGIDEDTVDFVANYDGYETEPVVLPARLPNLLVNGSSGIAVGMATTIPPHNLGEVVDALLLRLDDPEVPLEDLMEALPAPDFPTGGRIVVDDGIAEAYRTGRGTITVEAVAATETRSGGLPRIVITEIPYQVNKAALLERIADLVKDKKLDAVRDLRDESSRDGMRVVVELKRGEDPQAVLSRLHQLTELRSKVHVNMVALVGDQQDVLQPRTLGLVDLLDHYLAFQRDVLTRRSRYRRDRAAERAHVLEGLLLALEHLDDVVALIRASETADDARAALMERYELTEVQARAILDMPLRRLAQLERQRLADEHAELSERIAELEAILADPAKLDALLADELREVREAHADERRTRLTDRAGVDAAASEDGGAPAAPELAGQEVTLFVTTAGYCKSIARRRISPAHDRLRDPLAAVLRARTDDVLLAIDADGGGWRVSLADVPVVTMRQRGPTVAQLLGDGPDAPLAGAALLGGDVDSVITVSRRGLVKRSAREEFEGRTRAMVAAGVKDVDEIVAVVGCRDGDHLLLAHDGGQVIRFPVGELRLMGRSATGVAGLTVPEGGRVVSVTVVPGGDDADVDVLTLAADGTAKRAPAADYPAQGRGGKGVQTGARPLAWCGAATDVHVPTSDGVVLLRPAQVKAGKRSGRPAAATAEVTGPVVGEQAGR